MSEGSGLAGRMESTRTALNLARDGVLLIILLMLLVVPSKVNGILIEAGFTSASILGFDWEKQLEAAAQETEAAKQEVQRLNSDLKTQATRLEQVAQGATDPAAKEQAGRIAKDIRASQVTAARIGVKLGQNLDAQKRLQNEIVRQLPPRVP